MMTRFSRGVSNSGRKDWNAARMAQSPQPGHQRTSWSDLKSLVASFESAFGTSVSEANLCCGSGNSVLAAPLADEPLPLLSASSDMGDHILDDVGELGRPEWQAPNPVVRHHVGEIAAPQQQGELA